MKSRLPGLRSVLTGMTSGIAAACDIPGPTHKTIEKKTAMNRIKKLTTKAIFFLAIIIFVLPVFSARAGEKLIVFHAGSLSVPFLRAAAAFEKLNTGVTVEREAAGSRTCARKITDLNRPCDVMASADYTVIDNLLFPDHAQWDIQFATNEMAIMFRPDSPGADIINGKNWFSVLLKKGAEYGHSDPNSDPCGYRTMLCWQLAEKFYNRPELYDRLKKGCPQKNVRPKETDLIALLEAGEIDYLFIYRSVCIQHNMPYVSLPAQINLGSFAYADYYQQASVEISGKKPGTHIVKRGMPMVYGITVIKNAPHRAMAEKFIAFILGPAGREIMAQSGQQPLVPAVVTGNADELPVFLKEFLQ